MSYAEQNQLYRGPDRGRMEMCAREQALIYADSEDPASAALGQGVTGGSMTDIDAILAAVSVHQNYAQIPGDDVALLGAVQEVWGPVAAARYPQGA